MSSVKNIKSKSKGAFGVAGIVDDYYGDYTAYDYRRCSFKDTPPAKIVRPMRVVRARVASAHAAVDRAIQAGVKAGLGWPGIVEATAGVQGQLREAMQDWKRARRAAAAGQGHIVHGYAA